MGFSGFCFQFMLGKSSPTLFGLWDFNSTLSCSQLWFNVTTSTFISSSSLVSIRISTLVCHLVLANSFEVRVYLKCHAPRYSRPLGIMSVYNSFQDHLLTYWPGNLYTSMPKQINQLVIYSMHGSIINWHLWPAEKRRSLTQQRLINITGVPESR